MNRFAEIKELKEFLRNDREQKSLNPIRLINVDTMEKWIEVKKVLLSMSNNPVYLSSFCVEPDTTPNMRRFTAKIRDIDKSVCILPLSEYLRVNPNTAKETLEELMAMEYVGNTDGKLRIYIPMYRMKSVLQIVDLRDPRREDCISLLETGEDSDYSLTIIQKDLDVNIEGNEITGFCQYLQYWEQNPDKPLILHTANAIHFGQNVFFDNVKVIVTSFDLLRYSYQLPSAFAEKDGKDEFWNALVQKVSKERSFEGACCSTLLINKFTVSLFDKWASYDSFQRWLLWMWARLNVFDGYLGKCINSSIDVTDFVDLLINLIIELYETNNFEEMYCERKELLVKMGVVPNELFWERIDGLDTIHKISVLSDITVRERETIFSLLREVPENLKGETIDLLHMIFPSLANYICSAKGLEIEDLPREISAYFGLYRWNKASNVLPESFVDMVKRFAIQRGTIVYTLKSRNLIVNEEYDDKSVIVFVDGMGMEYVEYLYDSLETLRNVGCEIRVRAGYCNLPSTTEVNKDFLEGKNVAASYLELDEMKHGGNQYPRTIEQELSFLDRLAEKVKEILGSGVDRVIISSDHGTSRMAVLVRKTSFDLKYSAEGHSIYKYGRYCEGVDLAEKYETTIEIDNKLVFADYSRFEQKGAPADEIHGGASLEEWIVPVIIIDNADRNKDKLVVQIIPPNQQIRPEGLTGMITVKFGLKGYDGENVSVRVYGKKIICQREGDGYKFKCEPNKTDSKISVTVYVGNESIGKFSFEVKLNIMKNTKFDI